MLALNYLTANIILVLRQHDTVLPDSVRLLVNCIASTRASMLVFPVDQVDESGNVLGQIPAPVVSKDKSLGPLQCGGTFFLSLCSCN